MGNLLWTGIVPGVQGTAVNKAQGDHFPHRAFISVKETDSKYNE